jgi:hypothetical protein
MARIDEPLEPGRDEPLPHDSISTRQSLLERRTLGRRRLARRGDQLEKLGLKWEPESRGPPPSARTPA